MNRKILVSGAVLLVVSFFAVGGIMAQTEDPETEQAPQTEQQFEMEKKSYVEILATKLGLEVAALEQTVEEARAEFQAQFPERADRANQRMQTDREAQGDPRFQGRGPNNQGRKGRSGARNQSGPADNFFRNQGGQKLRNSGVEELHIHYHYEGNGDSEFGQGQNRGAGPGGRK
jgi:outer membrane murein-binding lipoprotein Lpp